MSQRQGQVTLASGACRTRCVAAAGSPLSRPSPLTSSLPPPAQEAFLDALRNNSAGDWIIVQGNEGGDLDSLVSALALSYVYTHQPEPQKAVALLQTEEGELACLSSFPSRPVQALTSIR